jgi:hypothetical protein
MSSEPHEDIEEKQEFVPKQQKQSSGRQSSGRQVEVSREDLKSLSQMKWSYHHPIVVRFLKGEQDKYVPRAVQRFGKNNFKLVRGLLFLFDREIVIDSKRKNEILDLEEGRYGGILKAMARLQSKYVNISRKEVSEYFGGSERRQLKARYQKQKEIEAYVHAQRPGTLQIDLTFYKGQQYPVFGAIDVFSRWCFYRRVPDKKATSVVEILKLCRAEFEKAAKHHKLLKVSTDSGVEFRAAFSAYLLREKVTNDRQVKSRKLIEALNRSLRSYVERLGWDDTRDLDKIITQFCLDYNDTKHETTGKTPNSLVSLKKTKIQNIMNKVSGRFRVKDTKGFTMATLSVGDTVRIYDPRRREVKAKQKVKLKGKIKLNPDDYVKQYTSSHRGTAPHWSLKVYTISKIIEGEKRSLYKVADRQGVYVRSELQKVRKVAKRDPRQVKKRQLEKVKQVKLAAIAKEDAKHMKLLLKEDPNRPQNLKIRKAKFLGRDVICFYKGEDGPRSDDPATVIDVYREHPIVWHNSGSLSWLHPIEFLKFTGEKKTKSQLDEYIDEQGSTRPDSRSTKSLNDVRICTLDWLF